MRVATSASAPRGSSGFFWNARNKAALHSTKHYFSGALAQDRLADLTRTIYG